MKLRLAMLLALASCASNNNSSNMTFGIGTSLGLIDPKLPEASGIAQSVINPGYLWSHNDGENPNEIYLIDTTAKVKMVCKLTVPNRDWEDIAVGAGPVEGKTYVYVGEIGDNKAQYDIKYIYRFEEPAADSEVKQITLTDTLQVQMSDGKRDTEAMLIDPTTKDLYLISKREDSVGVYKVNYPFGKGVLTALKLATIPYHNINAGSISPDGTEILLKDYDHIYYWKRTANEPIEAALLKNHVELPYDREAQGESITWRLDAQGFYTLSETNKGKPAYLMFYKRN
jgi:hypothetical protein